jgi:hypothetical protein
MTGVRTRRVIQALAAFAAFAAIAVVVVAVARAERATSAEQSPPPHLRLLRAEIAEGPPYDHSRMAERRVTFRIALAARPPCEPGRAGTRYTFVVSAFPWLSGSLRLEAVPEIPAHAKIEFACDPSSREWRSGLAPGRVTVRQAGAETMLELTTSLGELPAVEFHWVALASDGEIYMRTPGRGRVALWRIRERIQR